MLVLATIPYVLIVYKSACLFICPTSKKSSSRISNIKKVQQQNLPHHKSPVTEFPTSKKSSSIFYIHVSAYTCEYLYMWVLINVTAYTREFLYMWVLIHVSDYTRECLYTWVLIHVSAYTHSRARVFFLI